MKRISTLVLSLFSFVIANAQWASDPALNTLAAQGQECVDPIAVADSSGNTYISYRLPNGGGYSIYMQKVDALGYPQWGSTGKLLSDDDHSQTFTTVYSMAMGPEDHAVAAWEDSRTGNFDVFASRVSPDSLLVWGNGGLQLSFGANTDVNPQVLPMPDQSTIIAWQSDDSTGIYIQRVSADGTRMWGQNGYLHYEHSGTGLRYFSYPRLVLCNDTSFYLLFKKANAPGFSASQLELSINKFGLSAQSLWGGDIGFQTAGSIPFILTMNPFSDGNEGCVVAWMDGRGSGVYLDGYVQHIDPNGNSLLAANGQDVVSVPGSLALDNISAALDGAGNIYAFYNTSTEIYMQKVDPSGNLLLGANGALVVTAVNSFSQTYGQKTSRGFLINYSDDAFPVNTYSAAMFDSTGNFVWSNQILSVATSSSGKSNATVTEEKNRQVVVAWQDDRSGTSTDIYVQNIEVNGSLGVGVPELNQANVKVYPNPASNLITLNIPGHVTSRYTVTIMNTTGEILRSWTNVPSIRSFDVSGLAAGVYFLRVANEKETKTLRFEVIR